VGNKKTAASAVFLCLGILIAVFTRSDVMVLSNDSGILGTMFFIPTIELGAGAA
jgi:hypothetical protein